MSSIDRALALYRRGLIPEAWEACQRIIADSADDADALALLADIELAAGRPASAIQPLAALARLRPSDAANQRRLAGALLSADRVQEAIEVLRRAIALEPRSVRAHNNLGQALLQTGRAVEAVALFERALALDPTHAIAHGNFGIAMIQTGRYQDALLALERALALDASLVEARVSLAIALERLDRFVPALAAYDQVLAINPSHAGALSGRGALLARLNRNVAALESLESALRVQPGDPLTLARKASVLLILERAEDALRCAREALQSQPDFVEALNIEAGALCRLNRPAEALRCFARALELDPAYVEGWCNLAVVHQNLADHAAAVSAYRRALALDPECVAARTGLISALIPSVPLSQAESVQALEAFRSELDSFGTWLGQRTLKDTDAWTVARQQFFYLSYESVSNKALLQRYRTASADQLARAAPAHGSEPHGDANHRVGAGGWPPRFRLGIVSSQIYDHSVFNAIISGWLLGLDRDRFEVSVFSLGAKRDAVTQAVRAAAEHFEDESRTLPEWASVIRRRELDAVIFPEVGIDRDALALASQRLAARQFAAWGHPETTGLPTIDCYLSAEAFEPADAADHYSEHLICLPHLGVYYQPYPDALEPIELARWGLADEGPLLICPGTPFKYRPQDDGVLVEIARRLGICRLVFFVHERAELSRKLEARITAAFAAAGLDAARHLTWLPWLPRPAFLALMRHADVYLDTLGFSGFNTLMQAVQAHLPCVTLEGMLMRGRLGSGILRRLDLPELVAVDRAAYIDIAVRLAVDVGYRQDIRLALRSRERRLYADPRPIAALADLLLERP